MDRCDFQPKKCEIYLCTSASDKIRARKYAKKMSWQSACELALVASILEKYAGVARFKKQHSLDALASG